MTNGKFDNSKFKSFYNLNNFKEDEKKRENDEFGSFATLLLIRYTEIFKNYNSKITKDLLMLITELLIKLKTKVQVNSSSVKYPSYDILFHLYTKHILGMMYISIE